MSDQYASLSICVPAYNEQDGIAATLDGLCDRFPGAEIIVVDDGSTDDTAMLIGSVAGVQLVRHNRNLGYGASMKTAMASATRPVIAWFDGDGQHRPEDLEAVVAPVLEGRAEVVVGMRGEGSHMRRDWIRGRWMLGLVARLVVRTRIPDLNSGLRCFRREAILPYLHLLPDGFSASSTSTLVAMKRRYRVEYVPIKTLSRTGFSTVRLVRDGIRTFQLIVRMLILFDAFEFFSIIGGAQIASALAYGITVATMRHEGFPVLAGVLFISGVITFLIGLLCDQIVSLRIERLEDPRIVRGGSRGPES